MEQNLTLLEDERIDEVNERLRLIQKKHALAFGTDAFLLSAFLRPAPRSRDRAWMRQRHHFAVSHGTGAFFARYGAGNTTGYGRIVGAKRHPKSP